MLPVKFTRVAVKPEAPHGHYPWAPESSNPVGIYLSQTRGECLHFSPPPPQSLELYVGSQQMSCNWGKWTAILPVPVSLLQTRLISFFLGIVPSGLLQFPLCGRQAISPPACSGPDNGSATPLLFINTSLSYLPPFPPPGLAPSLPHPPLQISPQQPVPTAFQQASSSFRLQRGSCEYSLPGPRLPPSCPSCAESCFPLLHRWPQGH